MILLKLIIENIFKIVVLLYTFIADLIIASIVFIREKEQFLKNLKLTNIEGISFDKKTILIDGYKHLYTICGNVNAESNQTLIMMGGIPSDPSESLYWMASELIKKNPSLKILIIHLPFYENYSKIELTDCLLYTSDAATTPYV